MASFLAAYERKPWNAGTVNCMFFPAAWAIWLGHSDPVENWRGAFRTDDEFSQIVATAGGCVPLMAKAAARLGAQRLNAPICGAVGVIGSRVNINHQFGAIFDGRRWLVRFINKVGPMSAQNLAIWKI
ncbi:hypothetical protein [Rhizobium leguminosarum]|uniref:hypothetical protein n=1 Tax=Rhizobium leguminosarum TaxID=384 RepID=UPI001FD96289|nr:hypothetical protein [Rhizobium leguminosarum]